MAQSTWSTYAVYGYTHQVGTDGRATGGVHLHQVKRLKSTWVKRTVDANGRHSSPGPVTPIDAAEGEARYEQASSR